MSPSRQTVLPARGLLASLAYLAFLISITVTSLLQAPWLGLSLKAISGQVVVLKSAGPSAEIPNGAAIQAISMSTSGPWVELSPEDIMEEPDLLPDYPEFRAFFERQGLIARVIAQPTVFVQWRETGSDSLQISMVQPEARPLFSLPVLFWFQVLVCSLGCLIATWVWVLKPQDIGARIFGVTGLLFPAFVLPAAIYSGRELALGENLFFMLSAMNHLGALLFGAAFAGIFMTYPQRLVSTRGLSSLFVLMLFWWLLDTLQIVGSMDFGFRLAILFLLFISFLFGFLQFRQSKGKPLERASLRWLGLSLLTGASLYIFLFIASATLGWLPPIPQGYAFGFFLLIYIGIALGVGRYRLFDLDVWAYRLLLWIAATLAVVVLDAALIVMLDWSEGFALGVSLWLCGVMYFPLRQWLWQRLVSRNTFSLTTLLPELVAIAFSGTQQKRLQQWKELLLRIHSPLKITTSTKNDSRALLLDGGTGLLVPPCAGIPAFEMVYRGKGRQLFSTVDVEFTNALVALMNEAEAARLSREQGAIEERRRIASDIHDDVGARLLMLIHSSENPKQAELARGAMSDLRSALANIDGESVLLEEAVADWRNEVNQRCDAAKVELEWFSPLEIPAVLLAPRMKTVLERALRESLTNALKHGNPNTVGVRIKFSQNQLEIGVEHDGIQTDPNGWVLGLGMKSLMQRLAACGGGLRSTLTETGRTEVRVMIPLGDL